MNHLYGGSSAYTTFQFSPLFPTSSVTLDMTRKGSQQLRGSADFSKGRIQHVETPTL
jgi:hypothetical protein